MHKYKTKISLQKKVLNATLDLAALVLVGVVGFLGSEVVLSPVVSGCLPSCGVGVG